MKQIFFLITFSFVIALAGCNQKKSEENTKQSNGCITEQKTSDTQKVKLHTINSGDIILTKKRNNIKIEGVKDRIILLNFFATWCPPCKAEIPHLVNLQKKYKDKLKIISILLENDKPDSEIESFVKYNGINYTITNDKNNYKLSSMLGKIQSIPFMILYDKNGNVITHYLGAIPEEMINSDIKKTLK